MSQPKSPKLYHITHMNNLPAIVNDGALLSDAAMIQRGGPNTTIGMSTIKQRRLSLPVKCHAGSSVGDYVPFYFCPRSIMLYVIHCGNAEELAYKGGQDPIVHLEADLSTVVEWCDDQGCKWAFSLSNAGAVYTQFRSSVDDLHEVNWSAVRATDFRAEEVKEGKQAEFLVHQRFPWQLVERIGVRSMAIQTEVLNAIASASHQPRVEVLRQWYF